MIYSRVLRRGIAHARVAEQAAIPDDLGGVGAGGIGGGARVRPGAGAHPAQRRHVVHQPGCGVGLGREGQRLVRALRAQRLDHQHPGWRQDRRRHGRGLPLQMVGGLINKFPYDFVVAKNITSPAQLRDGKGAISGFGGSSDFATRYALTALGVDPSGVTLLQTGDETSRLAALQTGQIQFTVLTAGLDLVAFDMGYKPFLRLYTLDQPYQHTGIAINTAWAKSHPGIVDAFMKAIVSASAYIKNPLNIAAALALIHTHLPIDESHLRVAFQLYRDRFYAVYPMVTGPGIEFILRARKMDQPATDFYDNSYVQALQSVNFAEAAGKAP
ncbi:MAG: ABC transporter substrate-binding protein [Bacillati bacterium ANGP1]|uniref:ABC transporter substrate-binding protein n=1 Tax=Candidatus Segetimicrobium genomatis TaxID=2569760 RepID=A0A537J7Q2_9BACT|nr:MAG: ABC transporter substrate-binding protein [Terrabacteria group bacterium ANGP1]